MKKLLQFGLIIGGLYYLWDRQQKKDGNGRAIIHGGSGNGNVRNIIKCKNDIRRSWEMLTEEQKAMLATARLRPIEMICPVDGSIHLAYTIANLKNMGWTQAPTRIRRKQEVQDGSRYTMDYNSLIGLEGELL